MEKLAREAQHDMNVNGRDRFELWQNNLNFEDWNLTIDTHNGGRLRLFKISEEQLADLSAQIAEALKQKH